jgi:hypothetical protein
MVRKIQAGDLLDGRFEVQDVINRSGMVSVHCAFDRELQQTITLTTEKRGLTFAGRAPEAQFRNQQGTRRNYSPRHGCESQRRYRSPLRQCRTIQIA